jgi:hypothetical protein
MHEIASPRINALLLANLPVSALVIVLKFEQPEIVINFSICLRRVK